jgi:Xaa-Pro dipeptidase
MKRRIQRIFEHLSPAPDAVVLANSIEPHLDGSFFYIFDVASGLFEGSYAIALPDGHLHVLSSALEEESARQAARQDPDTDIHLMVRGDAEKVVAKILGRPKRIGLNFRELTHEGFLQIQRTFPDTEFIDASVAIRQTRGVKEPGEVERIEKAGTIASRVAEKIPSMLRTGMTELELAAEMEYAMNQHGAAGRSFATIVGFGANSAEPHYAPGNVKLAPGASMVCDFGALYHRYASDLTRSFHFGPTDPELKAVHETVQAAQQAALDILRPGLMGKEAHAAAQKVVDASPWKGRFTHGLGHALGLAVHDAGVSLAPNVEETLEPGMVVTVEPGIYLPGRGGVRIEDDVVITSNGYRFLTTAPRGYLEVKA